MMPAAIIPKGQAWRAGGTRGKVPGKRCTAIVGDGRCTLQPGHPGKHRTRNKKGVVQR